MDTLLINLYGAPCSGKSVKMMQLCTHAKMQRRFCEMSPEVAKEYVVQRIEITPAIQYELSKEQLRRHLCFASHVEVLVTDAPVLIGAFYSHYRGMPNADEMLQLFLGYDLELRDRARHVVNIFLWRNHPYDEAGRLETEAEDQEIAQQMWRYVQKHHTGQILLEAKSTDDVATLWARIIATSAPGN